MQLNQNYPWYLQTSPTFTKLYEGMFNVAKNFTSLDAYKVFYPDIMADVSDNLAVLSGLNTYATLWQIPTEISAVVDALVYDVDKWSDTKKWDGAVTGISVDWFLRYIKMKTFINQQVLCEQMIKNALDILFGNIQHTVEVTVENYEIKIDIVTDSNDAVNFFVGLTTIDSTLFGKPMGLKITYTISTGA